VIAIIDYNVGNVKSVLNACKRINSEAILTRDSEIIRKADGIILPGVGAFPVAMRNLAELGLLDVLNERKTAGIPILGICLGMQILFEKGYEIEECAGLGWLKGKVNLILTNAKLPHMGWNNLANNGNDVYFVHSYMADYNETTLDYCEYDGVKIPAIAELDNIMGCQFHPEKSGKVGEDILRKWVEKWGL
jgi:glutamine amidotransferase